MFYVPEREKRTVRVDQVYFSPNDRPDPMEVVKRMKSIVEKVVKDPQWLKVWLSTSLTENFREEVEATSGFALDVNGQRWETDEEYKRRCEHVFLRGKHEWEQHLSLTAPDVVDRINAAKTQLERLINELDEKIREEAERKSIESKKATIEKLQKELADK